jgi:hypothetical protein
MLRGSQTIGDDLVFHYYGHGISSLHKLSVGDSQELDSAIVATIITLMNIDVSDSRN